MIVKHVSGEVEIIARFFRASLIIAGRGQTIQTGKQRLKKQLVTTKKKIVKEVNLMRAKPSIKNFIKLILYILLLLLIVYTLAMRIIPKPETFIYHRVAEGETLSEIAAEYNPNVDWRKTSYWIQEDNNLPNANIKQGDLLKVRVKGDEAICSNR